MGELFYQDKYMVLYRDPEEQVLTSIQADNDAVLVPLLDEDTVLLAVEPSEAFGGPTVVLPGGIIEAGEAGEAAALRELQEEIGFSAARLDFLGEIRPWPKYLKVQSFVYLARGLVPSKLEGDEDYPILIEQVSLSNYASPACCSTSHTTSKRLIKTPSSSSRNVTECSSGLLVQSRKRCSPENSSGHWMRTNERIWQ